LHESLDAEKLSDRRQNQMTRDKEDKILRDAILRRRIAEIVELAKADPLYGISQEAAMKRAGEKIAQKYRRLAGEKKGRKK